MLDKSETEMRTVLGLDRKGHGARRWWLWALAAAVAGGVAWYILAAGGETDAPAYTAVPVRRADLVVKVTATGTVEPTNLVDISSELSGTLSEVMVDYNDAVRAGQELARLDTSELEARVEVQRAGLRAAEAQVTRATATLDEARKAYERARGLDTHGIISGNDLTTASAAFARARADLEVANANRALAAANLKLSETELSKACICSPISGVVLDRRAEPGQIVAASLSAPVLFTVAEDLTRMELQVAVDEADIGKLSEGDRATFTVDAYDDREFPAEIARIRYASQTVDGVVTYLATLTLSNADLALRPGMTATADIIVREVPGALVVPNAALRFAPTIATEDEEDQGGGSGLLGLIMPRHQPEVTAPRSGNTVWVLRDGAPAEVTVTPGDTDGRVTEIRGDALKEGDAVITGQGG